MIVLGIHGGLVREHEPDPVGFAMHDSAAVLVHDTTILAAIEEERLNRVKHSNAFPSRAIRRCLELGGIGPDDVDYVAVNVSQESFQRAERLRMFFDPMSGLAEVQPTGLASHLAETFGPDAARRLRHCRHHDAHAWSAFIPSTFEEALILSIDGEGENISGMVFDARGLSLNRLRAFTGVQSLGHFYQLLIGIVGYRRFDEYKVMALASYGDPGRYANLFAKLYDLLPDGNYSLCERRVLIAELIDAGVLDHIRRPSDPLSQLHLDFAAALQAAIERIALHVLTHYRKKTGHTSLCLAGGVAHNCSLNGHISRSGLFDHVFVQPAAHDAGGALGAALSVVVGHNRAVARHPFRHLYFGSPVGDDGEIEEALGSWSDWLAVKKSGDVAADAAALMAHGAVIGWAQGRSEFGPRALGNRSIVADPRPASNKDLINRMVKKREQYRPFAPSVLEEAAEEYFELPPSATSHPFMVTVLGVRPEKRAGLGAITHVDGTARVQTVSRETNPLFWRLIDEFRKLTGVPIVLNTSFNNHAEPIVDSAADAINCFLTTELTHLVVGRFIATKKEMAPATLSRNFRRLVPRVPNSYRVSCRVRTTGNETVTSYEIQHVKSSYFGRSRSINRETHDLLCHADGRSTVEEILRRMNDIAGGTNTIVPDLKMLWEERMLFLQPSAAPD